MEEANVSCRSGCEGLQPFLKWPGGKRWAAREISKIALLHLRNRYIEPFVGGGAVFFELQPKLAVLGDINPHLMETYESVRTSPRAVIAILRRLTVNKSEYYRIRAWTPRSPEARAARFLYLNRTAFAGLYRLNRRGQFNVPYAGGERSPASLWRRGILTRAATALACAELCHADFHVVMNAATTGDVVYCDPAYTVAHDNNGFVRYNERNFSWADQERLAVAAYRAAARGATVIISNAHHREIRGLYRVADTRVLRRTSRISADAEARREVKEYLFVITHEHVRALLNRSTVGLRVPVATRRGP